jgi:hypothetical protein
LAAIIHIYFKGGEGRAGPCQLWEVSEVPFNPNALYDVMECAFRHGVMTKFLAMQGDALEAVMQETDLDMGDLLNRMDETSDETVGKMDRMLEKTGFVLRYLNNDRIMRLVSRLLDRRLVKRMMLSITKRSILKGMTGYSPPSVGESIKATSREG